MRVSSFLWVLGLGLGLATGCKKEQSSEDPDSGSNLLGPDVQREPQLGMMDDVKEQELGESDETPEEEAEDEAAIADAEKLAAEDQAGGKKKKGTGLPPKAKPVTKCSGKGKKKVCKEVDPKPEVSASHGVVAMMGDFKWGQSPDDVFKLVTRDIEEEYEARQAKAKDAMSQDQNHRWRKDQIHAIKQNHVKFVKSANHRWGVSLVQFDYEDDNNEEMLWVKSDRGLRKFYFFKDGELWKIIYAYSTDMFPGKTYEQVVDEKFKKWFGPSPEAKVKVDPKTKQPLIRYNEWTAMKGEKIRSFDMTSVHGVMVIAVVDGAAEKRIGERLPNLGKEEGVTDVVGDVLGGSDVCYDASGSITECSSKK